MKIHSTDLEFLYIDRQTDFVCLMGAIFTLFIAKAQKMDPIILYIPCASEIYFKCLLSNNRY
jgi:hypothetical protein